MLWYMWIEYRYVIPQAIKLRGSESQTAAARKRKVGAESPGRGAKEEDYGEKYPPSHLIRRSGGMS